MLIAGTDIETTGLVPGDHRIIEVYAGLYDLATRKKVDEYVARIDPERGIPAEITRITGISAHDLLGAPKWAAVAPDFAKLLNRGDVRVAHNGREFDLPFINYELRRIGLPELQERPLIDTFLEGRWATPYGKAPNLGELCFACGVEYDKAKAHAAHYDVDVMMECFFRAYEWGWLKIDGEAEQHAA